MPRPQATALLFLVFLPFEAMAEGTAATDGCWMHLFSRPQYHGTLETYSGPTYGSFALRGKGSLLLGPRAQLQAYADADRRRPRLMLEPGTRIADLPAAGLQNHARSFELSCQAPRS